MPVVNEGVYLTRIPLKPRELDTRDQFATETPFIELIPFHQIAWVEPYTARNSDSCRILLNTLEFRCYAQSLEYVKTQVCKFVGRNARRGIESPAFPWVISQE